MIPKYFVTVATNDGQEPAQWDKLSMTGVCTLLATVYGLTDEQSEEFLENSTITLEVGGAVRTFTLTKC